jgi:hypothetical protein
MAPSEIPSFLDYAVSSYASDGLIGRSRAKRLQAFRERSNEPTSTVLIAKWRK